MRCEKEVRQRIEAWDEARAYFYPPLVVGQITFDKIVSEVRRLIEEKTGLIEPESEIRQRFEELGRQPRPDRAIENLLDWSAAELRWVLGEDRQGALRKVVWEVLVAQPHDATCTMRTDGADIVLEGKACPFDPSHPKRSFQFWVRFKEAKLEDDRREWNPVTRRFGDKLLSSPSEEIWILYPDSSESGVALTAQDNTLSGILRFSGDDYDFRIWDHTTGSPD